ncbi:hypothetical protein MMC12_003296 [Toensbergia leucococca]|nr:hypothetical protein [Toensbergia leucococca]
MLAALPMRTPRPPDPCDSACTNYISPHPLQRPAPTSVSGEESGNALTMSVMTRPKLKLQTAELPLPFGHKSSTALNVSASTDSPTTRNTFANVFESPPPLMSLASTQQSIEAPRQSRLDHHTSAPLSALPMLNSSPSRHTSPFPATSPYCLPIGARSILRNSPLPRRHTSATSARASRRMFPPVKRVVFHDRLEEIIPTPIIEESSDSTDSDASEKRQRPTLKDHEFVPGGIEKLVAATPVQGRRKRRRDWGWTLDGEYETSTQKDIILVSKHLGGAKESFDQVENGVKESKFNPEEEKDDPGHRSILDANMLTSRDNKKIPPRS